ncbi:hypothetical protein ACFX2G_014642 [Malus domestica]
MENQGSSICFHRFLELRITSLRFGVADLDCRMEKLKSNCRKPAMETRQQHIQVDLGISEGMYNERDQVGLSYCE